MADEKELTPEEPQAIRQQMEETRSSLNEKLQVLEQKVTSSVEEVASTVTETVQEVKESVQTSLETVRDFCDLRGHVRQRPWAMVGGAAAVGLLGGLFNGAGRQPQQSAGHNEMSGRSEHHAGRTQPGQRVSCNGSGNGSAALPAREPSWLEQLASALGPEVQQLKMLAIGAAAGIVRDLLANAVPEAMKTPTNEVMNHLTAKLGGEPFHGPLLPPPAPKPSPVVLDTYSAERDVPCCPSC